MSEGIAELTEEEKKFTVFRGFPVRTVQGNLSAM